MLKGYYNSPLVPIPQLRLSSRFRSGSGVLVYSLGSRWRTGLVRGDPFRVGPVTRQEPSETQGLRVSLGSLSEGEITAGGFKGGSEPPSI